mgnify:CR=1 FL=1
MASLPHLFLIDLTPTWSAGLAQAIALHHAVDPTMPCDEITKRVFIAGIVATIEAHDRRLAIEIKEPT